MNFFTVCMAPAIDVTCFLPRLPQGGALLKDIHEERSVGGKGINVGRALRQRGHQISLFGLLGTENELPFTTIFHHEGLIDCMTRVPGATRVNEVFSAPDGQFKLNRSSFPLLRTADHAEQSVLEKILQAVECQRPNVCIFSGSLPQAVPPDFYAKAIRAIPVDTVLDTSGAPLKSALAAHPTVIKPNADECADAVGFIPRQPEEFHRAIAMLLNVAFCVVLSDGEKGCWFADRNHPTPIHQPSPQVNILDTTGAGDALLAEFCHGYFPAKELNETLLQRAVAAGAAAVTLPGATPPTPKEVATVLQSASTRIPSET